MGARIATILCIRRQLDVILAERAELWVESDEHQPGAGREFPKCRYVPYLAAALPR
jgi:hypothetical protein